MVSEIRQSNQTYYPFIISKEQELRLVNKSLFEAKSLEEKIELILCKEQLKEELEKLQMDNVADISRIRYLKGLQIIRILYEKILSLDHHLPLFVPFLKSIKSLIQTNILNLKKYKSWCKANEIKRQDLI